MKGHIQLKALKKLKSCYESNLSENFKFEIRIIKSFIDFNKIKTKPKTRVHLFSMISSFDIKLNSVVPITP